jgi:hypothetical protein
MINAHACLGDRHMKTIALAALALMFGMSHAADRSPYEGEELRSIKSLTSQEIKSLQSGGGMGFAKLAELNHYPGPKHVLELADDLDLTTSQVAETNALFEEMQLNAVGLGKELLEAEMALDQDFSKGAVSAETLEGALLRIGEIRAQLRYVHLEAHIRQQRLLTTDQISKYDESRGYRGAAHDHLMHTKSDD